MSGIGLKGVLRDYIAAVAQGKVTLANDVSVITGTGVLLFLTIDTSYEFAYQTIDVEARRRAKENLEKEANSE